MRSFITILALLIATASHATSVNIDFDGATGGSAIGVNGNDIEVPEGFTFTTNAYLFSTVQLSPLCPVIPGPPAVGNFLCAISVDGGRIPVNFARMDGSAFDLLTLDVSLVNTCSYSSPCRSDDATISAWNSSNQLIATKTISYSQLGSAWSTIQFDAAWTGISRVTFLSQDDFCNCEAGAFVYLDNVNVNVVPIPPAIWLFGSALAGLGWLRRKQSV